MSILRVLLVAFVVVVGVLWLVGFLGFPGRTPASLPDTSDAVARAREAGAEIGERAAVATEQVGETLGEAGLTAKIKAKMALDDLVKARSINVTTQGTTVTLTGTVESKPERDRAVALASETEGVTRVVDELTMR